MQRDFIAVTPHTPILTVHHTFVEKKIHGAPVIDERDEVVGVVSTLDLLRVLRRELEPGRLPSRSTYFWDDGTASIDHVEIPETDALWRLIVRDAMTKAIVAVDPETPIRDVARTMIDQRIHRVLVMSDTRLVGVLTTFDLLFVIASPPA
jgi:CBS domain-containing protein